MADDEQRVRQLAYRIWESEGRPEGQAQRHWDMAWKIVAAERATGHDADLDTLDAPHDEAPIFEESPYLDALAADGPPGEVPVHDRGTDARWPDTPWPDTPTDPQPAASKKARATTASSQTPAKARSKTAVKAGGKTEPGKAGTSARKSPAAQKATQPETTKLEASKKRTRSSPRDKTPKPGDKPGEE
ncbi:MAG TPA: DUF2934 domain-containing protein [Halomonas sp.]|nr:DUF2934 domain-containing protein [Halomonas sp.]